MYKVDVQYSSQKTSAWVYIVNEQTRKQFMFRYIPLSKKLKHDINDTVSQARRLIKFMEN